MRLILLALIPIAQMNAATVDVVSGSPFATLSNVGSGTPNSSTFISRDLGNGPALGQRTHDLFVSQISNTNIQQKVSFASGTASNGNASVEWPDSNGGLSIASHDEAVRFVVTVKSTANTKAVPEGSTWMMLTAGMLLMGMSVLRNRRGRTRTREHVKNSGNAASRTMR